MKKVLVIVLLIVLSSASAQTPTSWTISPGYLQSYTHHYHFKYTDSNGKEHDITNQDFTPLFFYIWTLTSDSYSYVLQNYSRLFQKITLEDLNYANSSYILPRGDLPIILPLNFEDRGNWVSFYKSELYNLSRNNFDKFIGLENTSLSFSESTTSFLYTLSASASEMKISEAHDYNQYFNFLRVIFSLVNFELINATFTLNQEYLYRSGVLLNYKLLLESPLAINASRELRDFSLEYEMIFGITLPPINSETIDYPVAWIILPFLGLIYRRKFH